MTKIVINACFGGFCLSNAATRAYWARKGKQVFSIDRGVFTTYFDAPIPAEIPPPEGCLFWPLGSKEAEQYEEWFEAHHLDTCGIARTDPDLIAVVEEMGSAASEHVSSLKVIEIPDKIDWEITEYDGLETVEEVHRSWR